MEAEASQAYLSVLLHVQAAAPDTVRAACAVEARLTQLCLRNLERFEQQEAAAEEQEARGASGGTAGGWVDGWVWLMLWRPVATEPVLAKWRVAACCMPLCKLDGAQHCCSLPARLPACLVAYVSVHPRLLPHYCT